MITVFTTTYNRAYSLPRLYNSLTKQTNQDFEWLLIDDGSTDETESVIKDIINKHDSSFHVRYFKEANAGKAAEINKGALLANGQWFFIVDSDDWLPKDAVATIITETDKIQSKDVGVVCGMKFFENDTPVGTDSSFDTTECTHFDFKYRNKASNQGDLAEVIKTSILRSYPFPVFQNEKFCPEAVVFNRIALKYKTRYFFKNIYYCEYQPDGLSAHITRLRMRNWQSSLLCYAEQAQCPVPFKIKLRSWINFWRFSFCANRRLNITSYQVPSWAFLCKPLGFVLHLIDKRK